MAKKQASQAASTTTKLFVLDTNVLMHDPSSLFRFEEHDIYLPMVTLEELDNNKKILVAWGQLFDIDQLFEHAIVHILRHRRQIERFLLKLRVA